MVNSTGNWRTAEGRFGINKGSQGCEGGAGLQACVKLFFIITASAAEVALFVEGGE
jgi:hypothetical protein